MCIRDRNGSDPATMGSFGILQDVTELRGLSETIKKVVDSTAATGQDYPVSYTHLRAHETPEHLVCRLLLEKKKKKTKIIS